MGNKHKLRFARLCAFDITKNDHKQVRVQNQRQQRASFNRYRQQFVLKKMLPLRQEPQEHIRINLHKVGT